MFRESTNPSTALIWLLSPIVHRVADFSSKLTGFLGAQLATLGREIFVLIVRTVSTIAACSSIYVRDNVPFVGLKYSTLAIVLAAPACAIFYSRSRLQRHRIEQDIRALKDAKEKSTHALFVSRANAQKPDLEVQSYVAGMCAQRPRFTYADFLDRFERAATLPPQRKPRWEIRHKSYV